MNLTPQVVCSNPQSELVLEVSPKPTGLAPFLQVSMAATVVMGEDFELLHGFSSFLIVTFVPVEASLLWAVHFGAALAGGKETYFSQVSLILG